MRRRERSKTMDDKKAGLPEETLEKVTGGGSSPYGHYVCDKCGHEEDVAGFPGEAPGIYEQKFAQFLHDEIGGKTGHCTEGKMELKP